MITLDALLTRGGVWFNIPSGSPEQFIRESIRAFHLPQGVALPDLLAQTLERENMVSTAMGKGIALPHPKSLLAVTSEKSFIALAYPRFPLHWPGPDSVPVQAAFFIVSANQQEHLATLSSIAKYCSNKAFLELLHQQVGLPELLAFLGEGKHPT